MATVILAVVNMSQVIHVAADYPNYGYYTKNQVTVLAPQVAPCVSGWVNSSVVPELLIISSLVRRKKTIVADKIYQRVCYKHNPYYGMGTLIDWRRHNDTALIFIVEPISLKDTMLKNICTRDCL